MSTRLTMGRLKASQRRTKRAPFCEAAMSRVPARMRGWLATNPTGIPPSRAKAVTSWPAQRGHSSRNSPSSQTRAHHVAHVVGGRLAVGDDRAQLRRRAQHRVADGRQRRHLVGVARAGTRAARPRRRRRRRTPPRTARWPWRARPPRPARRCPISMPVNSATICGPDTKATASELMTTRSESPSRSAGPETTGPVAAAITGTCPLQREIAAAACPHPCSAATPSRTSAPLEATKKTKGIPSCAAWSAASASRTPSAWVMAPRRMVPERPGDDHVAPADPPDHRRDGADDPLADVGRLFHAVVSSPGRM